MDSKQHNRSDRLAVLVVLLALLVGAAMLCARQAAVEKAQAQARLEVQKENIILNLQQKFNYTYELKSAIQAAQDSALFPQAAQLALDRPPCLYAELLEGPVLTQVYPSNSPRAQKIGTGISDLNYAYTLARLTHELVVEGPLEQDGQQIFLLIEPLFQGEVKNEGTFVGEIAVALEGPAILESFGLEHLKASGYEYELWRVSPVDGRKETIALSKEGMDFSRAVELKFEMPTLWTLTIMPARGWVSALMLWVLLVGTVVITVGLALLLRLYRQKVALHGRAMAMSYVDVETGLLTRARFLEELAAWQEAKPQLEYSLIYIAVGQYGSVAQRATQEEKQAYLAHVTDCLNGYVRSNHLAGRVGESCFALAVEDGCTPNQLENLQKGLALELLWTARLDGEKIFLTADCTAAQFPEEGETPEELLKLATDRHFTRASAQSPARDLNEKCQRILNGERDVVFGDYPDMELNRLAKTLSRCRRLVNGQQEGKQ